MINPPKGTEPLSNSDKVALFTQAFMDRLGWSEAKSPQQELAAKAFGMRAEAAMAGKFAPRHPPHAGAHETLEILPGSTLVMINTRFPGNPMLIERGFPRRTIRAMGRDRKGKPRDTQVVLDEIAASTTGWVQRYVQLAKLYEDTKGPRRVMPYPKALPRTTKAWGAMMREHLAATAKKEATA